MVPDGELAAAKSMEADVAILGGGPGGYVAALVAAHRGAGVVLVETKGVLGSFILGLLFGVVSAPCAAPILIVLLTYLAGSGASVPWGGVLLLVYALGHSVLILIAGTSMGMARKLNENQKAASAPELLRRGAGVAIVLVGVYFGYRGLQ